ncbi:MAG: type II secretion system F family protein, partial [Actinobacteria bacterium]|nr:type II secretion system F family protein [Actinomycetota bacterium]
MTSITLALCAALGVHLLVTPTRPGPQRWRRWSQVPRRLHERAVAALQRAGLDDVGPRQFATTVTALAAASAIAASTVLGPGVGAVLIGVIAGSWPVAMWRSRRAATRRVTQEHWPRLIEELRVLVGPMGRPIPQALLEVGRHGPPELRNAFDAAQREWNLTTDFERTVAVLKRRLADPTADATCETLLVVQDVGGDLDRRLAALAEDRRRDVHDRNDARARLAGARTARMFVVLVPLGMAIAGLNVGDGRDAYQTTWGQVLVVIGIGLVAACWWWAARM